MSETKKDLNPFDFMNAASETKVNLIRDSDRPEETAKIYNPFITNKGFSLFADTILHANEMNMRSHIPNDIQFQYYFSVLRKRKRRTKWPKGMKDEELDLIQLHYECNRTVAIQIRKTLTDDNMKDLQEKYIKGGVSKSK